MKSLILSSTLLLSTTLAIGQFSVLQDGDGETSLQLTKTNSLLINVEREAIGFMVEPKSYDNYDSIFWNVSATINSKKGTANILSGGKFQFGGKLGATFIFDVTDYPVRDEQRDVNINYHYIGGDILVSRLSVFDEQASFDEQLGTETTVGFRANIGHNWLGYKWDNWLSFLGVFTGGVSVSAGVKDNSDELKQSEIITSSTIITEGDSFRTVSQTESAFILDDFRKSQGFVRINLDYGKMFLKERFMANLHFTYAMDQDLKPVFNPALGIFVVEKGAPLNAIVGLQLQVRDWNNSRGSSLNRWERTAVVLTAGFPFN